MLALRDVDCVICYALHLEQAEVCTYLELQKAFAPKINAEILVSVLLDSSSEGQDEHSRDKRRHPLDIVSVT